MPAHLYKYQPFVTRSLENLKNRTLWFSAPAMFNDPFDCALSVVREDLSAGDLQRIFDHACATTGQRSELTERFVRDGVLTTEFRDQARAGIRAAFEERRRVHLEERGVACFGETATNLLMWAHYADGHRGFCLEFDGTVEPFSRARKVVYRSDFPSLNPANVLLADDPAGDTVEAMLLTKAECWRYEDEWRVLHMQANHPYMYPWSALKAIHLGAAMPFVQVEIIALVLDGSPTKLFQVKRSESSFLVESQEIKYTKFPFE